MAADTLRGPLDPRACIAELEEYDPPMNPQRLARRLGIPVHEVVKLDANENPYGTSPRLAEALATLGAHWYPDPDQEAMRAALSDYVGVGPEHLLLGNGADELIDLLMRAYLDPGDELLTFTPTFGMYAFNAQQYAARFVAVERDAAFDVPLEAALAAVGPRTRLIFLTAPNNPTGNQVSESVVQALLDTGRLLVLDEAYAEFAGRSLVHWVPRRDNLVILRTFSKWAGLAGLRVGYGVLPPGVARELWKIKPPFNVNVAAELAVQVALQDRALLLGNVAKLVAERERLYHGLAEVPFLKPYPSLGNYLLCEVLDRDAQALRAALAERGILVRHYRTPRLASSVRISVGRPRDSERLLAALWSL